MEGATDASNWKGCWGARFMESENPYWGSGILIGRYIGIGGRRGILYGGNRNGVRPILICRQSEPAGERSRGSVGTKTDDCGIAAERCLFPREQGVWCRRCSSGFSDDLAPVTRDTRHENG